jgi:ribonuclease T2
MRTFAAICGAVVAMISIAPAQAEVAAGGTFTATQSCPAYQSIRKSTNPGGINVEPSKIYQILAKNKDEATAYRIAVDGAQPSERWVSATCGSRPVRPATAQPTSSP